MLQASWDHAKTIVNGGVGLNVFTNRQSISDSYLSSSFLKQRQTMCIKFWVAALIGVRYRENPHQDDQSWPWPPNRSVHLIRVLFAVFADSNFEGWCGSSRKVSHEWLATLWKYNRTNNRNGALNPKTITPIAAYDSSCTTDFETDNWPLDKEWSPNNDALNRGWYIMFLSLDISVCVWTLNSLLYVKNDVFFVWSEVI